MSKSISIIIPAYNEEKKLAPTVDMVLERLSKNDISNFEILIFDDASTDKTGEAADELAKKHSQIKVVHNPKNMNLGFNITRGFQLATKEYAGFVPGDNETSPESLDYVFNALGKADIIVPYILNYEVRTWGRRWLSKTYVRIINLAFGFKMRYYNGMCFFKTTVVQKVPVSTFGFAYMTEILVKLLKSGATFVEVPMVLKTRERGATKAFRLKNIISVFKTFLTLFWKVQILRKRITLSKKPVVIILAASSDIGIYLAKRYLQDGYGVIGTYRSYGRLVEIDKSPDCRFYHCDISKKGSIKKFLKDFKKLKMRWNIFISCVGDLRPFGDFFGVDFNEWDASMQINSVEQLRVIHGLYPFRDKTSVSSVVFFAGGGGNNSVPKFSAYVSSKIMLVKMCELLDAENSDLNMFIVGPGFVKTKIHDLIKADVAKGKKETKIEDIYDGIKWLISQDKNITGGRNFSIAYDCLGDDRLVKELDKNENLYKLRRFGNDFLVK